MQKNISISDMALNADERQRRRREHIKMTRRKAASGETERIHHQCLGQAFGEAIRQRNRSAMAKRIQDPEERSIGNEWERSRHLTSRKKRP